jgi:N,N'-diacetyllegionaminate synthase
VKPPLLVYETANVHGGDAAALEQLIDALGGQRYANQAIKFHPIAADTLALPDFSYYGAYQKLEIPAERWRQLVDRAHEKIGSVWLEGADLNCMRVLAQNLAKVDGIKLQSSILDNHEVFSALGAIDLSAKTVVLNIAGFEVGKIAEVVGRFRTLRPGRIALQVGFQAYPTAIEDALLNKIAVLRAAFADVDIAIADHVDGGDPFARRLPLIAASLGCTIIEKHVCIERATAPLDGSAALEPAEIAELTRDLTLMARCFDDRFIAAAEAAYLEKTVQRPIVRDGLDRGQLVAPQDLLYRRTDRPGLTMAEIGQLQRSFHILARPLAAKATVSASDFRPAHVAAIVAGRMKSTRLPKKATAAVNGVASVERTLENCLRFPHVRSVVLATSTLPEDGVLEGHTLGGKAKFWKGEPDDVIRRYLGACDAYDIDVVVRVTADCLTIAPEITRILVEEHFAAGADFTRVRREAPGSAPQIFNVEALRRIDRLSGGAVYSEYMNQYVENNPEHFKIHWVDLPDDLVRQYRLTLDYPEDLAMYQALYGELERRKLPADLRNVIAVLDSRPDIAGINAGLSQIYLQNQSLIDKLKTATRFPEA